MRKIMISILLVAALLLNVSPALALPETKGVKITYVLEHEQEPDPDPTPTSDYVISMPTDCPLIDSGDGFSFYADSLNIADGYEVVVRINTTSYAQDNHFNLYLNGDHSSSYKIPCTLKRYHSSSYSEAVITPGDAAIVATFRGTDTTPYKWGGILFNLGNAPIAGRYSNTMYFDISLEPIQ